MHTGRNDAGLTGADQNSCSSSHRVTPTPAPALRSTASSSDSARSTMCSAAHVATPSCATRRPTASTAPTGGHLPIGGPPKGSANSTTPSAMPHGTSPTSSQRCTKMTIVATDSLIHCRCCETEPRNAWTVAHPPMPPNFSSTLRTQLAQTSLA